MAENGIVVMFGHRAQVGKDSAADLLVARNGFYKFSIANEIKFMARDLYKFSAEQLWGTLKDVKDVRYNLTPREILQKLSDAVVAMWEDVWSAKMFDSMAAANQKLSVVSDLRKIDEVHYARQWCKERDKRLVLIKLNRKVAPVPSGAQHCTEIELDSFEEWDAVIDNNGTYGELWQAVTDVIFES